MSSLITVIILIGMGLLVVIFLIEDLRDKTYARLAIKCGVLLVVFLFLNLATGFPKPSTKQAFGGVSPLGAIGLMFVCIILGMAARYIFYLKGKFSWLAFVKPLCVSPIVLLPLFGSVQGMQELETIQMVSFGLLAFQNGFFWQVVLDRAKPQT